MGAAYLLSKAITHAKVLALEDLGMEAIYEFELKDFPVTVGRERDGAFDPSAHWLRLTPQPEYLSSA